MVDQWIGKYPVPIVPWESVMGMSRSPLLRETSMTEAMMRSATCGESHFGGAEWVSDPIAWMIWLLNQK